MTSWPAAFSVASIFEAKKRSGAIARTRATALQRDGAAVLEALEREDLADHLVGDRRVDRHHHHGVAAAAAAGGLAGLVVGLAPDRASRRC